MDLKALGKAALIGAVAGMRSLSAPALVAGRYSGRSNSLPAKALGLLENGTLRTSLNLLAAGELIGDKLPFAPARTEFAPQAFRFVSGAVCGAVIADEADEEPILGALVGGIAAIAACHAAYHIRKAIDERTGLPDAVTAVGEDAIVYALGSIATGR